MSEDWGALVVAAFVALLLRAVAWGAGRWAERDVRRDNEWHNHVGEVQP